MSPAMASFSSLDDVTMTKAPRTFAIESATLDTPPPMPQINTTSPGCKRARVCSIRHAVNVDKEYPAASAHEIGGCGSGGVGTIATF